MYAFSESRLHTDWNVFMNSVVEGYYHMWFISMMIGIYMVIHIFRRICEDEKAVKYFGALYSIAIFVFVKSTFDKKQAVDEKWKNIIEYISRKCFGIYLVHVFCIRFLQTIGIDTLSFNPVAAVWLITLVVLFVSLGITMIISLILVLRRYII